MTGFSSLLGVPVGGRFYVHVCTFTHTRVFALMYIFMKTCPGSSDLVKH